MASEYSTNQALGTREILREESEVQPNGRVFQKYVLGGYNWKTYAEFGEEAERAAVGLRRLGLASGDRIAILAETRAQWIISAAAAFRNNLSVVTIYTNLGSDGVSHALNETEVSTLLCSHETSPKVKAVLAECPHLKNVVLMESQSPAQDTQEVADDLLSVKGAALKQAILFDGDLMVPRDSDSGLPAGQAPTPDDVAIIMYTSGSTGKPKGVMLTHRNIISAMGSITNVAKFRQRDRYIAYLPLAHVLELLAESIMLMNGMKLGYS